MKIKFKQQKFQADAAKAVCDVFLGQPKGGLNALEIYDESSLKGLEDFIVCNEPIVQALINNVMLKNLQLVQKENGLAPSKQLAGHNFTVEMETGVGKTYTYIKTMYELHKLYGWSKFVIVVPSVAIREGVYKSFEMTEEHFLQEYGKKIRYFIYNSKSLNDIRSKFAFDDGISVMIINSQAFNARGKDARRIYMQADNFQSRAPIDIIAKTNPIVIID